MKAEIKIKLETFAKDMENEMDENAHKGEIEDWKDIDNMIVELEWHKAKLMYAMRSENKDAELVREHIADCANILFAMGNSWGLYD